MATASSVVQGGSWGWAEVWEWAWPVARRAAVPEKTPYLPVATICSFAAWVAGSIPTWEANNYRFRVEDPRVFLLPMLALSALAFLARLIRHYGGPAGAGQGWRVLTAGCALYLVGEACSWPLAFAVRYSFVNPMPGTAGWYVPVFAVGLGLLGYGAGVLYRAPRLPWRDLFRALAVLLLFLVVGAVIFPVFGHARVR